MDRIFGLSVLLVLISQSDAKAFDLSAVARGADGKVLFMNQGDAQRYCRAQGYRLPTIRELAEYYNPDGVLISESSAEQYEAILRSDWRVDFYYDSASYRRGKGEETFNWFWSATPYRHNEAHTHVFDGISGRIVDLSRATSRSCTVRCLID